MSSLISRVPQLAAPTSLLVRYCVHACSPLEFAWASQPILKDSGEDKDLEAVALEYSLQDKRNAADLLFQRKKEAYLSE